ncbi:uncharacterized protein YaiI (UPF0178 family) [Virgibacillus natechei]|uniref:Uncharacterized protein YaiI (UPF0178 family) n=1 Tax=Virgibacillus natechei TaxID=1216297 RepID=A0ABS4IBX1_9BACI|nr:uncharacterized protein YaiI (UPF0178 family) [Virgibacillus natechei]
MNYSFDDFHSTIYGLALLELAKGGTVLHHKGFIYTNEKVDNLLQTRYISSMARKIGKRTKGPKPYTAEIGKNSAIF